MTIYNLLFVGKDFFLANSRSSSINRHDRVKFIFQLQINSQLNKIHLLQTFPQHQKLLHHQKKVNLIDMFYHLLSSLTQFRSFFANKKAFFNLKKKAFQFNSFSHQTLYSIMIIIVSFSLSTHTHTYTNHD